MEDDDFPKRADQRNKRSFSDPEHPRYGIPSPGRPQTWGRTPAMLERICDHIRAGRQIKTIGKMPDMPSAKWINTWRGMDENVNAAMRKARSMRAPIPRPAAVQFDQLTADIICDELRAGKRLTNICKAQDMPAYQTVKRWRRQFHEFDNAVLDAQLAGEYKGGPGIEGHEFLDE